MRISSGKQSATSQARRRPLDSDGVLQGTHSGNQYVDPENLETLAQAALQVKNVRESAHHMFSPIYSVLDSADTNDLIAELLEKHTPPGKAN